MLEFNGTTHDIRQIHDGARMARIENSSQPTSSRKGFDEHIVAVHNEQLPHFLVPGEYSHYHQQDVQLKSKGLTIIIDNQAIIMIINRTNGFIIIIPFIAIKIFSLSSVARADC
jgi:hypothetical protein